MGLDIGKLLKGGLKTALGVVTGGLSDKISKAIKSVLPEDTPPQVLTAIDLEAQKVANDHTINVMEIGVRVDEQFNTRLREHEGTASDLKSVKVIGPLIILLRGAFRPLFSYYVAFCDHKWFSGEWKVEDWRIVLLLNGLVLGFYFGERALKNLIPHATRFMKAKNGNATD